MILPWIVAVVHFVCPRVLTTLIARVSYMAAVCVRTSPIRKEVGHHVQSEKKLQDTHGLPLDGLVRSNESATR